MAKGEVPLLVPLSQTRLTLPDKYNMQLLSSFLLVFLLYGRAYYVTVRQISRRIDIGYQLEARLDNILSAPTV